MNDLIQEIEDDIRHERMQQLWHKVGKALIVISAVVVLATVVAVLLQNHRQSAAIAETSKFIKGLDRINVEDYKGAAEAFDTLTHDESTPYYGLAMLRKAQAQNLGGDHDGALKTYKTLAERGNAHPNEAFGAFAKILTAGESDKLLEVTPISPLYYAQSERKAWQLVAQDKNDDAASIFLSLSKDEQAPLSMRRRCLEALQYLAPSKRAALHEK